MQVEERLQILPEKWSFAIREMISSVMPENIHSESHNSSMFSMNLYRLYARWYEILLIALLQMPNGV